MFERVRLFSARLTEINCDILKLLNVVDGRSWASLKVSLITDNIAVQRSFPYVTRERWKRAGDFFPFFPPIVNEPFSCDAIEAHLSKRTRIPSGILVEQTRA